jgi:hypothetical protein
MEAVQRHIDGVPIEGHLVPQNVVTSAGAGGRAWVMLPTVRSQRVVASSRGKADTVVVSSGRTSAL